jgi:hypothetical protein
MEAKKPLFDANNRHTERGNEVAALIYPECQRQIDLMLSHGYTLRTAIGACSVPCVSAETYNVCPKEFQALWILEVVDAVLVRIMNAPV